MLLRRLGRVLTIALAGISAALIAAGPASAAPNWQSWVRPADTTCGTTDHHVVSTNVLYQTCLVFNFSNHTAQAVLLVRNNASVSITMRDAYVHSAWSSDVDAYCVDRVLEPGQLLACYGTTSRYISGENIGWGGFTYNGKSDRTPSVVQLMP